MIFHTPRRRVPPHAELIVSSFKIDKVESYKYLGLTFDSTLKWDKHISVLQKQVSLTCGLLWKVSKFVPTKQLIEMYHAFVQSKLQYLVSIWAAAGKTRLRSLQTTQNRCLKAVYQKPRLYSTFNLYNEAATSILPITALREMQSVVQIQNLLYNPVAHHNQSFSHPSHRYETRNNATLTIRRPNSEASKKSFAYYGKRCYNALPSELKAELCANKFKKLVSAYIRAKLQHYLV